MNTITFKDVTKRFSAETTAVKELNLEVAHGELLVVVGPSGCGKSTTLRMLAGLEDITEGELRVGDQVINELSAKDRGIAMVFQNYALYPHMSVGQNLSYPLRLAKMPKAKIRERVLTVASQLQLGELIDRKPRQLSGGQRQRVAMGRAMVRQPKVFLMDEPLSNLDAKLRVAMRSEIKELQQNLGTTMFYVTHDQVEAMTMGHRVAVMNEGELQQISTPGELYSTPSNVFVAGFIGSPPMNLFSGLIGHSGALEIVSDSGMHEILDHHGTMISGGKAKPGEVIIGVRPEHLKIAKPGDGTPAMVRLVEMLGSESLVHLEVDGIHLHKVEHRPDRSDQDRVLVKSYGDTPIPSEGEAVSFTVDPGHIHMFSSTTGRRL